MQIITTDRRSNKMGIWQVVVRKEPFLCDPLATLMVPAGIITLYI